MVILLNRTTPIFLWCLSTWLAVRCSHICEESVVSARPILDSMPPRSSWALSICITWTLSTGECSNSAYVKRDCFPSIHRDLKPENILIDHEGFVKVSELNIPVLEKPVLYFPDVHEIVPLKAV